MSLLNPGVDGSPTAPAAASVPVDEVGATVSGILARLGGDSMVTSRAGLVQADEHAIHLVLDHEVDPAGSGDPEREQALVEELLAVALELRFPAQRVTVEGRDIRIG